jgi:hypothetical protein
MQPDGPSKLRLTDAQEEREFQERNEKRAKELGFSCAEEMRGELRRSGLIECGEKGQ